MKSLNPEESDRLFDKYFNEENGSGVVFISGKLYSPAEAFKKLNPKEYEKLRLQHLMGIAGI